MLSQFAFYARHSFNDLRVNRRLTFFALLSIAAGVAAIVSLQTLAVMIGDTLQGNLQETNRGDISVDISSFGEGDSSVQQGVNAGILQQESTRFMFGETQDTWLTQDGLNKIRAWLDDNGYSGVDMTFRANLTNFINLFLGSGDGTAITATATGDQATQLQAVVIDPAKYPFYSTITTLDGKALADVMTSPEDVVISEDVAKTLGVTPGDTVQINSSDATFTVVGIVPQDAEIKGAQDMLTGMVTSGYYYLGADGVSLFDSLPLRVDRLFFKLPEGQTDAASVDALENALNRRFPYLPTTTTTSLSESNKQLVEQINQLVTIMGLVSLLIGSIGIVNTMQVIVRRRTLEVAVLKTIGLQAGQVTLLFLTEAFIMGVIGSLIGIVLGWGATFLIKGVAESLFAQSIGFRLAPGPAINGLVVGVLVTTVFGFLPTLTAGQVRPASVLRPMDNILPKAGRLRSLLALVIIILAISVVANSVIGSFGTALGVVAGAFIAAGFLYLWLSFLIWLIGRLFPSLGLVDLKIALRQMLAGRARGASTLLALVVGVFSLSLITLFADSITGMMNSLLTTGGNVIITVANPAAVGQVRNVLDNSTAVQSYNLTQTFVGTLVRYDDVDGGVSYTPSQMRQFVSTHTINYPPFFQGSAAERRNIQTQILNTTILTTRIDAVEPSGIPDATMVSGHNLTAADSGQPELVLTDDPFLEALGMNAGDTLTFSFSGGLGGGGNQEVTFTIAGLRQQSMMSANFSGATAYALIDSFPAGLQAGNITMMAEVDDKDIPTLRRDLSSIVGVFMLPTSVLNKLISSLLGTFIAFPTMVALLGLIVGGVVIANSVALTTMERRREIAVMKAVGLQRERVLAMLLLENGILGFIGGLIGVGIGLLGLILMTSTTGAPSSAVPYGTALVLMLLCIGVALVAALTSAWGASGEKPLNVLRYE